MFVIPWILSSYGGCDIIFCFFSLFIYFWEREHEQGGAERESMSEGGAEGEGDTECKAGSRLWAVSIEPDKGFKPTNCEIMTWAEVRGLTNWATQEPLKEIIWLRNY